MPQRKKPGKDATKKQKRGKHFEQVIKNRKTTTQFRYAYFFFHDSQRFVATFGPPLKRNKLRSLNITQRARVLRKQNHCKRLLSTSLGRLIDFVVSPSILVMFNKHNKSSFSRLKSQLSSITFFFSSRVIYHHWRSRVSEQQTARNLVEKITRFSSSKTLTLKYRGIICTFETEFCLYKPTERNF